MRHIVVIRPDRVGDAILSTPALRNIRNSCPDARISVIASVANQSAFNGITSIDEVIVVGSDTLGEFWKARKSLASLKDRKPDAVFCLDSKWPCALLAWWLGAPHRIGYKLDGMDWLFSHAATYPFFKQKAHQVTVNLHLLKEAGFPIVDASAAKLEVSLTESGRKSADLWLSENGLDKAHPLVAIHPGSRSNYTRWPAEKFGKVADAISQVFKGHVLIVTGYNENSLTERMLSVMKIKIPVAKELDFETLACLFARCDLFIGNATGTMHLASAVCPRVIAVIGGTHPQDCPERWGPWGSAHKVVHKPPKEIIGHDTWQWLGQEGLRYIMPEDVIKAVIEKWPQ